MALRIRLARFGAKKRPFYRIVVTNSESPRDGRFLEIIGTYDPRQDPAAVTVKEELLSLWVSKGATPTDTVASLLKKRPRGCRGRFGGLSAPRPRTPGRLSPPSLDRGGYYERAGQVHRAVTRG